MSLSLGGRGKKNVFLCWEVYTLIVLYFMLSLGCQEEFVSLMGGLYLFSLDCREEFVFILT